MICDNEEYKTKATSLSDFLNNLRDAGINAHSAAENLREILNINIFKEYLTPKNPTQEELIEKKKKHKPFYKNRMNLKKWER